MKNPRPKIERARRAQARLRAASSRSGRSGEIVLRLVGDVGETITFDKVERELRRAPRADVRVEIDTPGGSLPEAFKIYRTLRAHQGRVSGHVAKKCCSAGVVILLACRHRTAAGGATLMIHGASLEPRKKSPKRWTAAAYDQYRRRLERDDAEMAELIAKHTGARLSWIKTELATEDDLPIAEALKRGFIHEVTDVAPAVPVKSGHRCRMSSTAPPSARLAARRALAVAVMT